jgi:hypothetical protein
VQEFIKQIKKNTMKRILLALLVIGQMSAFGQCLLSADYTFVVSGGDVTFTNTSTDQPAIAFYDWSYNDQSSTLENPVLSQASTDMTACFTVYDSTWSCFDSICYTIPGDSTIIDSTECNLVADFIMTIDSGYVYFTNTSTDEPTDANYDWWYGNSSSTDENPSFPLDSANSMVCLTVYDSTWDCYDSTCFMVDPASASIEKEELTSFEMYPNPASSELNIAFAKEGSYMISVYDASGRLVQVLNASEFTSKITLDVAEFENGLYIINVLNSESNTYLSKRFMKF